MDSSLLLRLSLLFQMGPLLLKDREFVIALLKGMWL
ncbi:hypothetical protein FHS83_000271 [Rhizomicrobium palustre]|uniref:Uncharacterized protein n=1 Tax=Rhizomicrobium palustre TaxID=189966 RepID=A0A846MUC0_9PROT|nr:hypothetical protein [Rhizomicrobium palustre]